MSNLSAPITHLIADAKSLRWTLEIIIVASITILIHIFAMLIYRYGKPRLKARGHIWQVTLLNALHKPFGAMIWALAITYALDIVRESIDIRMAILEAIDPLRTIIVSFIIVWGLVRYTELFEETLLTRSSHRDEFDRTSVHAVGQLIRIIVIFTGIIIVIQGLGIPLSGVLTFSGVGGLAAGFAAKDTLGNFFGGLMIYIDKPFKVGDWIRSPEKDIEGNVEHIGWRVTTIRNFDQRPMYVPNGTLTSVTLENGSRMSNRRINTTVGLRYEDVNRVADITKAITDMLRLHPEIDKTQKYYANLINLGASTLDILIYAFTLTTDHVQFRQITQDVLLKAMQIIADHGASCAYPVMTLDLPNGIRMIPLEKNDVHPA